VTVIAKAITTTMKVAATKAKKRSHSPVITEEMNDVENLVSQSLVSKKNHCG